MTERRNVEKKENFEIRAKKSIFQTVAHLSSKFHSAANVFCRQDN